MDERVARLMEDPRKVTAVAVIFNMPFALINLKVIYAKCLDNLPLTEYENKYIDVLVELVNKERVENSYDTITETNTAINYTIDSETGQVVSVEPVIASNLYEKESK